MLMLNMDVSFHVTTGHQIHLGTKCLDDCFLEPSHLASGSWTVKLKCNHRLRTLDFASCLQSTDAAALQLQIFAAANFGELLAASRKANYLVLAMLLS